MRTENAKQESSSRPGTRVWHDR